MLDAAHRVGLGERRRDPVGDRDRLVLVGEAVDQDPELVAAEAGDDVPGPQVRAQPWSDRPQQFVAAVVADAVVDELEAVEVEEQDPDRGAGDGAALERDLERLDEAGPVREAGERVVEDAVPQGPVGRVALDRVGEDVGRGLGEVDVLRGEPIRLQRVDVEDAERALAAVDRDREAAAHPHHPQRRRHREAPLGLPVVDDHVQARLERRPGVGVAGRRGPAAAVGALDLGPGEHPQAAAVAADLPDAGAVDAVDLDHQRHRLLHQRVGLAVLEGVAREAGDGRLLGDRPAQVLLGDLALGDVVEHAVPDRDAVVVRFQHRLVEDPDDVALAGDHPVVDRPAVAVVAAPPAPAPGRAPARGPRDGAGAPRARGRRPIPPGCSRGSPRSGG